MLHKHRQENAISLTILSNSEAGYLGTFSDALKCKCMLYPMFGQLGPFIYKEKKLQA